MAKIAEEMKKPEFRISAECILDIVGAIKSIMNLKYHPLSYIGKRRVSPEYKKVYDLSDLYETLYELVMDVYDDIDYEMIESGNIYRLPNTLRRERINAKAE